VTSQRRYAIVITLSINDKNHDLAVSPDTPLLWALREAAGLTGTKYGCGKAFCGACTVHIDGSPVRSCSIPVASVGEGRVTTIEGLSSETGKAVQASWLDLQVPQCGFCQSGQIMSATALLDRNADPSDADIDQAMQGNICRCATYVRIRKAIKVAAANLNRGGTANA
jgi:isoquinoline 1-oxidoreductase alpha subunit